MDEIVWEDPPETALVRGRAEYKTFAAALREHPNRWGVLPGEKKSADSAKGTAGNIKQGRMGAFPKGEFEAVAVGLKIHVRYTGQASSADAADDAVVLETRTGRHEGGEVRAWARENGFEVAERGALPRHILAAFEEAQDGEGGADG